MKKENFQLLLKGIATNKMTLLEFKNYHDFRKAVDYFSHNEYHIIITTNSYIL